MKNFKYVNSVLGAILFLFGIWCFVKSGEYVPLIEMEGQVGANVFPELFSGALMFLAALMVILDVKNFTKPTFVSFESFGIVAVISVLCFVFWYCIPKAGFLFSACIFTCVLTFLATRKIRPLDLVSVVVVTGLIYFVFATLLKVPLPHGFFI
ncbi:MAG: tripartite tricarboxylate transporter TctB family protein [Synergistaceae bacterium]|nr:tripartite tricarboxylate transporter TctB family protein [Synergistaceae bacterium]